MLNFVEKPSGLYSIAGLVLTVIGMLGLVISIIPVHNLIGFRISLFSTSIILIALSAWLFKKSAKLEEQEQQQEFEAYTEEP